MKKVALILALSAAVISTGCKKKYCWLCTIHTNSGDGIVQQCDKTKSEVKAFMDKQNYPTDCDNRNGITLSK